MSPWRAVQATGGRTDNNPRHVNPLATGNWWTVNPERLTDWLTDGRSVGRSDGRRCKTWRRNTSGVRAPWTQADRTPADASMMDYW